jgi:acetyl-CoA acetyltransferase
VTNQGAVVAEAFVLETLRIARTKASPRGGFAGVSPVDLLVSLQRELVRRTGVDPGRTEDVIIGCVSQNAEQAILLGCVVDELDRRGGRYGVAAVSGAAGLGVAVLVQRVAS